MERILFFFLFLPLIALGQPSAPDRMIAAHAKKHNFSGSIAIEEKGKLTYAKSFGLANIPFKVVNTDQTKYKIASITKAFTSVLILQLYEQGKIDIHEPIRKYLPSYVGEAADKVTIHQLLNHTSGLPNFDTVKSMEAAVAGGIPVYQTPYSTDQLIARFCSGALVNTPGKVFDYNNADYIILGKVIEQMYRKTFEEVLKERVLQPLRMNDTGMLFQKDIIDGLASTYFFRDDIKALVNDFPVYPENWYAAGSMYSTAKDVLVFSNALFSRKLLKRETLALMTKPGLDDYGYGVWSYETTINGKKFKVVKRPGQIMGAQSQLYRLVDQEVSIVILSNTGTTDLDEFVARIGKAVAR
jgi:D-alanyl-D-alanine carboxypeptidase